MNKRGNIVLIGMPGSGKSTVGVLLAKALGMAFVDTDLELMQRTGKKLQEILDQDGLAFFLDQESETVRSIKIRQGVIATGGSVVLEPEAMAYLRETSRIIFLDVPLTELQRRITNIRSRGIAFAPGQSLEGICQERLPLYRKYADFTVPMEENAEDTVEAIWQIIKKNPGESCDP